MKALVGTADLSMFARWSSYVGIFLGCLIALALAQEPAGSPTTDAPVYKVGDTWTFLTPGSDGQPGATTIQTVKSVTETQTTIDASKNGGPPYEVDLNNQGDMLRSGVTTWDPEIGWLSFPMTVGKSWDHHDLKQTPSGIADITEIVKVEAYERVHVAAGTFDAYRIVVRGVYKQHVGGMAVPIQSTHWYAPSVKAIIKFEAGWTGFHHGSVETTELTAFSLAP